MKIVWENCWTIPPQMRPTKPNRVIIIRDNFSARPCPSKSCKDERNEFYIRKIHLLDRWMTSFDMDLKQCENKNSLQLTICVGNISASPIFALSIFSNWQICFIVKIVNRMLWSGQQHVSLNNGWCFEYVVNYMLTISHWICHQNVELVALHETSYRQIHFIDASIERWQHSDYVDFHFGMRCEPLHLLCSMTDYLNWCESVSKQILTPTHTHRHGRTKQHINNGECWKIPVSIKTITH